MTASSKAPDTLTMYSTSWCGYCARLKAQLERDGITFVVVDIEQTPAAAEFVMSVNGGNQTVPTVHFPNGAALTNPTLAEVRAELAAV
ncbi:MAG TPA: mycoredoxin [Actinophytocola sp.]|uniref:mycoredoxin n=1 Tax=Actinophytocola sp. TaxID=1872138 RepID=UPI002E0CDD1F|nr:mycoredoxin [Actinophytocola sp.]